MTRNPLSIRTLLALAVAAAALAAGAGSAIAGGHGGSKNVPDCPAYTLSQPFSPWLDFGHYYLAPGGSFENGLAGWTATGGAAVVSGNESFYANGPSDSHSLSLPPGSSVTTPSLCVSLNSPDLRLFVRNSGSVLSLLRVDLNYTNIFGKPSTLPVGVLVAGQKWSPSLPVLFLEDVLAQGGLSGQTWVSFTLTPMGANGNWQVDDLYVDPLKNH